MTIGSITGATLGGLSLGVVPELVLVPGLALLLVVSAFEVRERR
jgi:hypothetical protein